MLQIVSAGSLGWFKVQNGLTLVGLQLVLYPMASLSLSLLPPLLSHYLSLLHLFLCWLGLS